jgi:hypothetical protein
MSGFYPARQVLPGIWIGSMADAASKSFMREKNIGLIVNCTADVPAFHASTIPTIRIPIDDHESFAQTFYDYAPAVAREMRKFLERYRYERIPTSIYFDMVCAHRRKCQYHS